ncbi:MAG: hypothetical protein LUQ50_12535, partial [Methanospirillum sp.]|uniref:hypothetical protein n=1 Tax=Methanospirillum sp. TaxID=45200 RepID=UPI00236B3C27
MNTIGKEELIQLLRESDSPDSTFLEDPEITSENFIPTLKRLRIIVSDDFFATLADRLGLTFMERESILGNLDLGCILPYAVGEEDLIVLLESKPGYLKVLTANPLDTLLFVRLEEVFKKKIERVVTPLDVILTLTEGCYEGPHGYSALNELVDRQPDESAYRILVPWQKGVIVSIFLLMLALIITNPYFWLFVFFTILNISYFVMNPIKFYISFKGLTGTNSLIYVSDEDVQNITDGELPVYTILVPLFHEQEMLPHILQNISDLDYPRDKLDVKILMEEEDT